MSKIQRYTKIFSAALSIVLILSPQVSAISITAPSNGQIPADDSTVVSGSANAGRTVIVSENGSTLGGAIADGSGNWSTTVSGLSAGTHTLTATEISTSYGYFSTTGASNYFNRVLSGDTTLNPGGGGYPALLSSEKLNIVGVQPTGNKWYIKSISDSSDIAGLVDISAPAEPVSVTGYDAIPGTGNGASTLDGTKLYLPDDELDQVTVVDYATNTAINTIPLTVGQYQSTASTSSNGLVYVVDGENLAVINPATDTIVKTIPTGCTGGPGLVSFPRGQDYYYLPCAQQGSVQKRGVSDDTVLNTYDVTAFTPSVGSVYQIPDGSKAYINGVYGTSSQNKIFGFNTQTGELISTITLTAASFAGTMSPDGQYIYAPTQGSFDTQNIDVISTATDTIIDQIDTSALGIPGPMQFAAAEELSTELSVTVASAQQLASTGSPVSVYALISVSAIFAAGIILQKKLR